MTDRVHQLFSSSIQLQIEAEALLGEPINQGGELIVQRLLDGSKILCCGNSDASHVQYFTSLLINRFERERPGLPALALTTNSSNLGAIADDYNYDEIFARQIHALGHAGDLLLTISNHGQGENISAAIEAAHERQMYIIALTSNQTGRESSLLEARDVEIRVPTESTTRTHELHLLVIHALCDLVDYHLLGA